MAKVNPTELARVVQVRFPDDLLEAIDREVERVVKERGGEAVGRSEIIRAIVRRALLPEGHEGQPRQRPPKVPKR